MHRKKWFLLVAALVAVMAFAAAGCGGEEEAAPPEAVATETAPPAAAPPEQVLRWALGAEPPSLDPGLATDTTSANILLNLMDPLVRLSYPDLEPVPTLAESWDVSEDGKTVTFHLRQDGRWTNGDPVTAKDFEYSWKRSVDPAAGGEYAYQFYGIVGAADYNGCEKNCEPLRDKVGVKAIDDYTLEVKLTSPQPWFIQQMAHHSFLAVHQATVEQFGDKWTEPENIVTNGPFKLESWEHDASLTLVKNPDWRDAANVTLERVEAPIIVDGLTAVQAFEAGEVDVLDGQIPPQETPRVRETPEYEIYPALGTYYYGFNVKNVPDVNQRRAMSLAIDRRTIIDEIAQAGQLPPKGFTPEGMPGYDVIVGAGSPWTPESGDIEQAKQLMGQVASPVKDITLVVNDSPGHREIAVAVQAMWKELGIKTTIKVQEWAQFLEFIGPPPNKAVDVYRLGWIGDFVDAINFLELWTCESGNNSTNFCDPDYDKLVEQARATPDNAVRYDIYGQLETILTGPEGAVPIAPIYYYTYDNLERLTVKDTFNVNLLFQLDLSKVVVQAE